MTLRLSIVGVLVACFSGCQNWPQSKRMMQYQIESERLLSEFRAQKKRADELEDRNKLLANRLSESEKMLATLQSSDSSRVARLSSATTQGDSSYDASTSRYSSEFQSRMNRGNRAPQPLSSNSDSRNVTENTESSGSTRSGAANEPVWRAINGSQ